MMVPVMMTIGETVRELIMMVGVEVMTAAEIEVAVAQATVDLMMVEEQVLVVVSVTAKGREWIAMTDPVIHRLKDTFMEGHKADQ